MAILVPSLEVLFNLMFKELPKHSFNRWTQLLETALAAFVTIVADSFKSAETTANWEMELSDIARGKSSKKEFLEAIENEIKEVILTYCK